MDFQKPKNCNYPNCFDCPYTDCRYERVEHADIVAQDKFDKSLEVVEPEILARRKRQKKYIESQKGKDSQKKYSESEKGRERQKKYIQSAKGKEAQKRYRQSEKGKENEKRKSQKRISSGKNAEYCRRYYYKKKMQTA